MKEVPTCTKIEDDLITDSMMNARVFKKLCRETVGTYTESKVSHVDNTSALKTLRDIAVRALISKHTKHNDDHDDDDDDDVDNHGVFCLDCCAEVLSEEECRKFFKSTISSAIRTGDIALLSLAEDILPFFVFSDFMDDFLQAKNPKTLAMWAIMNRLSLAELDYIESRTVHEDMKSFCLYFRL